MKMNKFYYRALPANVLNEHELSQALSVRAALLASFGRDAFEVKEKKS